MPPAEDLKIAYEAVQQTKEYGERERGRRNGLSFVVLASLGPLLTLAMLVGIFAHVDASIEESWPAFVVIAILSSLAGMPAVWWLGRQLHLMQPPGANQGPASRVLLVLVLVLPVPLLYSMFLGVYQQRIEPFGIAITGFMVLAAALLYDGARTDGAKRLRAGVAFGALAVAFSLTAGALAGGLGVLLLALAPLTISAMLLLVGFVRVSLHSEPAVRT